MVRNPNNLRFQQFRANELPVAMWEELAYLNMAAVERNYEHLPKLFNNQYMQRIIGCDDLSAYRNRMCDPNIDNDQRSTPQLFRDPVITIAHNDQDHVLSWVFSVDNTSGATAQQKMNAFLPIKRWRLINWMATHPDVEGQGLATRCVAAAIQPSRLLQPVSAYTLPGDRANRVLVKNGLMPIEPIVDIDAEMPHDQPLPTRHYVSGEGGRGIIRTAGIKWRALVNDPMSRSDHVPYDYQQRSRHAA